MTSFVIKAHEGREIHENWRTDPFCPFCKIIRGDGPAYKVYEDDKVIAVLGRYPVTIALCKTNFYSQIFYHCVPDIHWSSRKHIYPECRSYHRSSQLPWAWQSQK